MVEITIHTDKTSLKVSRVTIVNGTRHTFTGEKAVQVAKLAKDEEKLKVFVEGLSHDSNGVL